MRKPPRTRAHYNPLSLNPSAPRDPLPACAISARLGASDAAPSSPMVLNERSSDVSRSIPLGAGSYDRTLAGVIGRLLALGTHAMSEACLFLNIWAPPPGRFSEALPVLVWIHGGSFTSGGSTQYTGDHFIQVRDDVVLVTLNYRYRLGVVFHAAWHPMWHELQCGMTSNVALASNAALASYAVWYPMAAHLTGWAPSDSSAARASRRRPTTARPETLGSKTPVRRCDG